MLWQYPKLLEGLSTIVYVLERSYENEMCVLSTAKAYWTFY